MKLAARSASHVNKTKARYRAEGLCVQCGIVPVKRFRWCLQCRRKINGNFRRKAND